VQPAGTGRQHEAQISRYGASGCWVERVAGATVTVVEPLRPAGALAGAVRGAGVAFFRGVDCAAIMVVVAGPNGPAIIMVNGPVVGAKRAVTQMMLVKVMNNSYEPLNWSRQARMRRRKQAGHARKTRRTRVGHQRSARSAKAYAAVPESGVKGAARGASIRPKRRIQSETPHR
jgi:hypothetical protein